MRDIPHKVCVSETMHHGRSKTSTADDSGAISTVGAGTREPNAAKMPTRVAHILGAHRSSPSNSHQEMRIQVALACVMAARSHTSTFIQVVLGFGFRAPSISSEMDALSETHLFLFNNCELDRGSSMSAAFIRSWSCAHPSSTHLSPSLMASNVTRPSSKQRVTCESSGMVAALTMPAASRSSVADGSISTRASAPSAHEQLATSP
eukprot:scaffold146004_cov30-Tisochrysis_lutea.AAC.2